MYCISNEGEIILLETIELMSRQVHLKLIVSLRARRIVS
jgi:hypothetical protein